MSFSDAEKKFIEEQEAKIRALQTQNSMAETTNTQQAYSFQEQEKGMVKEQLDLSEEMERIENLLRGRVLKKDKKTRVTSWEDPEDNEMVILSEYGVHLIMNTISWYINKNTLLSNYDEETILQKMEDFAIDLADTVFMEYDKVFEQPTFEDCKKILDSRMESKVKLKIYAAEIVGKSMTKENAKQSVVKELEGIVERELEKIKQQIIKNKLKRFLILIREIQDSVHSTYLRALYGQERKTIREHTHITEVKGGTPVQSGGGGAGLLDWIKRR